MYIHTSTEHNTGEKAKHKHAGNIQWNLLNSSDLT